MLQRLSLLLQNLHISWIDQEQLLIIGENLMSNKTVPISKRKFILNLLKRMKLGLVNQVAQLTKIFLKVPRACQVRVWAKNSSPRQTWKTSPLITINSLQSVSPLQRILSWVLIEGLSTIVVALISMVNLMIALSLRNLVSKSCQLANLAIRKELV